MGVSFGTTAVSATAVGYATDVFDVTVVLASSFDKASVAIDAPLKGEITITLADAAPVGGVTFNLSADDGSVVDFTNEPIVIPEGETQSQPIELRGLSIGSTTLRASATNATEATAEITVDATIEAYLIKNSFRTTEALIGVDLQDRFQVKLGATPLLPVNIKVSVPENSGVLLSIFRDKVGSNTVVLEGVTGTSTQYLYIQGTSIGDEVPLTIEITEADTGYFLLYAVDQVTVDVDPSGLALNNSDTITNRFANDLRISASTFVLYDDETPARAGERLTNQQVRGGFTLEVPLETSDASVVSFEDGQSTGTLSLLAYVGGDIYVDPDSVGEATVSIASYPNGFSDPADLHLDGEVEINVLLAKAYLSQNSNNQTTEAVVGVDLQAQHYLRFEGTPPRAVDVVVSVPEGSGVLLSNPSDRFTSTVLGQSSIMVVTNSTNLIAPRFYIQGETLGDGVDLTIQVFETGTTTPIGYDVQAATVDVDPSGIYISTQDFTSTLPDATSVKVQATMALLHDGEGSVESGKYRSLQQLRGGAELTIPVLSSDSGVVALPDSSDIVMIGGSGNASIFVDPIGPGTSTISIDPAAATLSVDGLDLPASFVKPSDRKTEVAGTINGISEF